MEGQSIELEILCDGEQPLNKEGEPAYNTIQLYDQCTGLSLEDIKTTALSFLHFGIYNKIYLISPDNCITGNVWATNTDGKKTLLGRYVRRSARFVWEQSV
jgi:hypothetical protein